MRPQGRLDVTPIGIPGRVVIVDPLTHRPLSVWLVDPRALEVDPGQPRDQIHEGNERYRAGRDEMRTSGVRVPLVALSDGLLVDGLRRLMTALELGFTEIPVVFLDGAQARAMVKTYPAAQRAQMLRKPYARRMLERIQALARAEGSTS